MLNHSPKSVSVLLSFGLLPFSSIAAPAKAPAPVAEEVDTTSILEMGASPEEKMIYGDTLPKTPESGNENAEDLLKSSPIAQPHRKKDEKTASAKGAADASLPKKLKETPSTKPIEPELEELPPPPPTSQADALAPEADVAIPGESLPEPEVAKEAEPPLPEVDIPSEPPAEVAEGTTTHKWDRSIPLYDRENPSWGVDIHGSMKALGSTGITLDDGAGGTTEFDVRNFGLGFEWEPQALQSLGVISVGPSANLYIVEPMGDITSGAFSIFSFGGSLKYQLRYARAQPVVPFVGFEAQMIRYSFTDTQIGSGWTTSTGLTLGGMLLLNWMEPSAAHSLWSDTGIKRSYLVGELKMLRAGEPLLSVDGQALYFGLRMEY